MPPSGFSYKRLRVLNDGNHILDLPTGIRLYVRGRLHDKGRKIRSGTSFFRPNRALPADGLTKTKTEQIPVRKITQSSK
jgi:hypothetical protein